MVRSHRHTVRLTGGRVGRRTKKYVVNQPVTQKVSRPKGEKSKAFKAKYPGTCPACYREWVVKDLIRRCGQFYYHDECVK